MGGEGIVIVGSGAAGASAAGTLRAEGYDGSITVVRGEDPVPYNRTTVNKSLLQGALTVDDVTLPEATTPGVDWLPADRAVALDTGRRTLTLASGRCVRYAQLIIATGAAPRPFPGEATRQAQHRILTLRTARDARALRRWITAGAGLHKPSVTILGAGLIGAETAGVLAAAGTRVHLVSRSTWPMGDQLGRVTAEWLAGRHRAHVDAHFGRTITHAHAGSGGRLVATLDNGDTIASDVLLTSIGVKPGIGWLHGTGLHISDGVAVDDHFRAHGAERAYAAGDLARVTCGHGYGQRIEHWSAAVGQGRHAALTLLHDAGYLEHDPGPYHYLPTYSTRLYGTKLVVVGQPQSSARETVLAGDPDQGRFTVAHADADNRLTAVVGVGGGRLVTSLRDAVYSGASMSSALAAMPS